jgi:outer membrane protein assembly factor BamB
MRREQKEAVMKRLFMLAIFVGFASISRADWNQFRGPAGGGVADDAASLPVDIGPDSRHLVWKSPVPKGHSTPVVHGDRIFLTGLDQKTLRTFAVNRLDGKIVWSAEAPYEQLESVHRIGSHATPSVATDGQVVISMFGSSGLFCYDVDGKQLWHRPMGPFNNNFGAASSPLLVDDRIVMVQDHDTESYLAVYDKMTGDEIWKAERSNSRRNYSTPCIWTVDEKRQIVVVGSAHVVAYDFETGDAVWTVRGVSRVVNTTPVVGDDNRLYVACTGGSETEQPEFAEVLNGADANTNGTLEQDELPKSPIKSFFSQFDRDANGSLDKKEYNSIREIFSLSETVAMAIRPGGTGDITSSHVDWKESKSIPRNASPLYHKGLLFLVADGGIATSINADTGEMLHRGRLSNTGKYYSSPAAGDGKLYIIGERGHLTVVSAEAEWEQLAESSFEEDVYASPAISDGCVFVRTVSHLYCFAKR